MNLRSSAYVTAGIAAAVCAAAADEGPAAGWEDDLAAARTEARDQGKLLLQFRLIGAFDRADC